MGVALLAAHPAAAQKSTSFQINPAHDGATVFPDGFKLPLEIAWSRKWPIEGGGMINDVSHPLIADGKVFVTVTPFGVKETGTTVYTLSLKNGRVLWKKHFRVGSHWSASAYDNGRLFVVTAAGNVAAVDVDTGSVVWRKSIRGPGIYSFSSTPTAADGRVFISGGGMQGTLFALDQTTGQIIWQNKVIGHQSSAPTVDGDSVFVAYGDRVYKFDAATGALRWLSGRQRSSGGTSGVAPFYADGIYVNRTTPFKMHSFGTGDGAREFAFDRIWKAPAFYDGIGYFVTYFKGLEARSTTTRKVLWRKFAGSEPALPPIVVNGHVLAISHGAVLSVLNGKSGKILQELPLPSHVTPNGELDGSFAKGMAAGEGMIVVPADDMLFALRQASN